MYGVDKASITMSIQCNTPYINTDLNALKTTLLNLRIQGRYLFGGMLNRLGTYGFYHDVNIPIYKGGFIITFIDFNNDNA